MSQISWYFLGILSVILSAAVLKFGLILVFFSRIEIGLVFGFCGCHFIGIGLVSVCHFPENGIPNRNLSCDFPLACETAALAVAVPTSGQWRNAAYRHQSWQLVAKSGFSHWFLPAETGWQKMWVAKSGKK